MIGRLVGRIEEELDGTLIVDVNGVGYEIVAPLGTRGRATTDAEGRAKLFVHTHVREDVFALFGFATEADRFAFRQLISVSSVGPKTAVGILSALPGPELGRAIAKKELAALTAISGIGKKTAERLILELRDKIPVEGAVGLRPEAAAAPAASDKASLLASALVNMGYRTQEADRAIAALGDKIAEGAELGELLREALKHLSK